MVSLEKVFENGFSKNCSTFTINVLSSSEADKMPGAEGLPFLSKSLQLFNVTNDLTRRKTPNDFGFQKLCFPLKFVENIDGKKNTKDYENIETKVDSKSGYYDNDDNNKSIDSKVKIVREIKRTIPTAPKDYLQNIPKVMEGGDIYGEHSKVYSQFMQSYLKETNYDKHEESDNNELNSNTDREMRQGDEVISFDERKEYVKKLMMNARFDSGDNYISHNKKMLYDNWKITDGFNLFLSFLMYENAQLYQ